MDYLAKSTKYYYKTRKSRIGGAFDAFSLVRAFK